MPNGHPKRAIKKNLIQAANIYRQEILDREEGRFVVNWHGVWTIFYSRARAHAQLLNSRSVPVDQPWYRDWLEPDWIRYETDWDRVQLRACHEAFAGYMAFQNALYRERHITPAVEKLKDMLRKRQLEKKRYWNNYQLATSQTMDAIHRKVADLEGAMVAARFTRNVAAEVLVTMATGPLGQVASLPLKSRAGLVAASSLLKVYGKWTDTRNVGATAVTLASELTLSMLPLGASKKQARAIFLITTPIKGTIDTDVALIEGNSVAKALVAGGQGVVLNSLGQFPGDAQALAIALKAMSGTWSGVSFPSRASYRPGGLDLANYPDPLSDTTDIIADLLLTRDVERMAIKRIGS